MHPPSTAEGHDTVSAEDALEHMSVEKAWHLLADLSSQVVRKQSELQVGAVGLITDSKGENAHGSAVGTLPRFSAVLIAEARPVDCPRLLIYFERPSQLMVGSRYHELIESADSIVSMKEISTEVLGLLQSFPHACSNVLEQVGTIAFNVLLISSWVRYRAPTCLSRCAFCRIITDMCAAQNVAGWSSRCVRMLV